MSDRFEWPTTGELDVEDIFNDFWQNIVCLPDGSPDLAQIKRELYDYHMIIQEVPKVYGHVTGGRISKPHTKAHAVIGEADDRMQEWIDEAVKEALDERKLPDQPDYQSQVQSMRRRLYLDGFLVGFTVGCFFVVGMLVYLLFVVG